MALEHKQTTHQHLVLAPNMTLALEVLRMAAMELRTFVEQQVEENPFLELEEEYAEEPSDAPPDAGDAVEEPPASSGLDEDWLSHWGTAGEWEPPDPDDADNRLFEQGLAAPQSLHDSLRLQLGCQELTERDRRLGETLLSRLDEQGYLRLPLEELAAETGEPVDDLRAALRLLQNLDPPGVGARDLRECLMLQLEHRGSTDGLAYRILRDHFPLFVEHRLGAIAKATGAAPAHVTDACAELQRLNPRPGYAFSGDLPPSIVPELVIHHRETHYDVELNDQAVPHLAVSRAYRRMLKDARTPGDAKAFLAQKFQRASWLIKAIDERNATLLSIARCLISLQREFLDLGPQALKPLTQAQVAGLIGRHPSTVSRAIAGKTIDTPFGVFRLEQFFASGVPQGSATECVSDERIKSEIQRLIAEENPARPLSDAALTERLAQGEILVARRTIAKYRTDLKILPAHLRKRRN